jgi:glycosyltransferase involved in cell wall biosynthesis
MARLLALCDQLGLQHHLILPGHQSNLRPWFTRANIFVLPSHSEGSPNVILEAMAASVPIAATAAGGTPEIITHEHDALLSPVSQPRALAANFARLLDDPPLRQRLLSNALITAQTRFSPDQYRENILAIYRSLLPSQL